MLEGVMLLWFIQVAVAVVFVAVDIRSTPEATVMKWGFVIITAFSGLLGALLYVLACREPLPGTHEAYVAARWRQAVGSTMHCVAGDGVGILAAAVITSGLGLPMWAEVLCEYVFGFVFGWTVFQALFMRGMYRSYRQSLRKTFLPELLSMNAVMGGMTAVMVPWMSHDTAAMHAGNARFWFVMSIALCAGFVVALPVNWWLVAKGLKHGMMTVRRRPVPAAAAVAHGDGHGEEHGRGHGRGQARAHGERTGHGSAEHAGHGVAAQVSRRQLAAMTALSLVLFGLGFLIGGVFGDLTMHG